MNARITTIHVLIALAVALSALPAPAQNLYQRARRQASLIADLRARSVGDILTISIDESHQVKNEDKVDRSNETSLSAVLDSYTLSDDTFKTNVLPELDIRQSREFEGQSKQEKDSNLSASIAVIVVDVQPNGNLVVSGSRTVQIDDETKTFRLSGIVRPHDVSAANSVSSTRVADARISLTGSGGNTRYTTRGPVGAFFDTLIWAAWPF